METGPRTFITNAIRKVADNLGGLDEDFDEYGSGDTDNHHYSEDYHHAQRSIHHQPNHSQHEYYWQDGNEEP